MLRKNAEGILIKKRDQSKHNQHMVVLVLK